jgi:hypothetical protein
VNVTVHDRADEVDGCCPIHARACEVEVVEPGMVTDLDRVRAGRDAGYRAAVPRERDVRAVVGAHGRDEDARRRRRRRRGRRRGEAAGVEGEVEVEAAVAVHPG